MPAPSFVDVRVTVVVVTWQGRELLKDCLASLASQDIPHRVLVVDNASTDGTDRLVAQEFPEAELLRLPTNTGFAGGVAAALERVDTRFVALLNNDAMAEPRWLGEALAFLDAHHDVAAVSSRMLLADDETVVNNTGITLLGNGYGSDRGLGIPDGPDFDEAVEVFGASGGAAVLRTLAVKAVGGLEPRYFMYYEDADLSWRLRLAGWRIAYCPTAVVRHRHAASSRPGSTGFAFHTERNRLLTLVRCAPARVAITQVARFAVTTASIARSRALHRPLPDSAVFLPLLRLRVLASAARLAPDLARVRISSNRAIRRRVWLTWRDVPERTLTSGLWGTGS